MKIDREKLVKRHNIILTDLEKDSPLSIGNGQFCFNADVTGFQGLSDSYEENNLPLCTMSQWFFHKTPISEEKKVYSFDDLKFTEFDYAGRTVKYAYKPSKGNENVYEWLRKNPHKGNLAKFTLMNEGKSVQLENINSIKQQLDLFSGILLSSYKIDGKVCEIKSWVDPEIDGLNFVFSSDLVNKGSLSLKLNFGYPSPNISGVDYDKRTSCKNVLEIREDNRVVIKRTIDDISYFITILSTENLSINKLSDDDFDFSFKNNSLVSVQFSQYEQGFILPSLLTTKQWWKKFWETGAAVQLSESRDSRAIELERRIILSQYLQIINCTGSIPPSETGLLCNSWYGKFHLEMYPFHVASLALFGKSKFILKSLSWYKKILPQAIENARINGYKGARWPKMVGPEGLDSPSFIATLLVWQQPHVIFLLELIYRDLKDLCILEDYWEVIKETADFMVDFLLFDEETGQYNLVSPLIPVQEEFDPNTVLNPTFEIQYFKESLLLAIEIGERLNKEVSGKWADVANNLVSPMISNDVYVATYNHKDTFEKYNKDHPSMLMSYGLLKGLDLDSEVVKNTLSKTLKVWDYKSLWGWDFAILAMCASRLNLPDIAIDSLLIDTDKNTFVKNGHNYQKGRADLPSYLPGNGALLWAIALMVGGFDGCSVQSPGFPKDGSWTIEAENFIPML